MSFKQSAKRTLDMNEKDEVTEGVFIGKFAMLGRNLTLFVFITIYKRLIRLITALENILNQCCITQQCKLSLHLNT